MLAHALRQQCTQVAATCCCCLMHPVIWWINCLYTPCSSSACNTTWCLTEKTWPWHTVVRPFDTAVPDCHFAITLTHSLIQRVQNSLFCVLPLQRMLFSSCLECGLVWEMEDLGPVQGLKRRTGKTVQDHLRMPGTWCAIRKARRQSAQSRLFCDNHQTHIGSKGSGFDSN